MSIASDGTDEGQALQDGDFQNATEVEPEPDAVELGSPISEATGIGRGNESPRQSSTIKGASETPVQPGDAIDEEFSDFQRPASADGSLSTPDDLPSIQVLTPTSEHKVLQLIVTGLLDLVAWERRAIAIA